MAHNIGGVGVRIDAEALRVVVHYKSIWGGVQHRDLGEVHIRPLETRHSLSGWCCHRACRSCTEVEATVRLKLI